MTTTPLRLLARGIFLLLGAAAVVLVGVSLLDTPGLYPDPPWSWLLIVPLSLAGLIYGLMAQRLPEGAARIFALSLGLLILFTGVLQQAGVWPRLCVLLIVVALLQIFPLLAAASARRRPHCLGVCLLIWTSLVFGCGIIGGYAEQKVVVAKAETLAGDRPYCLQTASQVDPYGYDEVRSFFDLNAFKARARLAVGGGVTGETFIFTDHLILLIEGGEVLHWSYKTQDFELDFIRGPGVTCVPRRHFSNSLSLW